MAISKSSGSIFVSYGGSVLADTFNSDNDVYIKSGKREGLVGLNDGTVRDLTRLGVLYLNGERIYGEGVSAVPENLMDAPEEIKAAYVFQKIEQKFDSTALATGAARLLDQRVAGDVYERVLITKNIAFKDESGFQTLVPVSVTKKVYRLTVEDGKFKYITEWFARVGVPDEKPEYFKIKTMVSGTSRDLEAKDCTRMSVKVAYTSQRKEEKKALQESFLGTMAGGLFDTETFIKA